MNRFLLGAVFFATAAAQQPPSAPSAAARLALAANPVLVELFTSEGCSSCPPADALIEKLDRLQPFPEARVIVLSEHVDYWDHQGWRDPFSSASFTARQEQYARQFGSSGPYTPQMVVDGAAEFVGSDAGAAASAIRSAARREKVAIRLVPGAETVRVEVDPLPGGKKGKSLVYVALAQDSGTSNVSAGENRGRTLHHVAIVRQLRQIGSVSGLAGFTGEIPASPGDRIVAFVQDPGSGRIRGAGLLKRQ